jgi:hypothetical protein
MRTTNTTNANGSKSVHVKITAQEKSETVILSVLGVVRTLTPLVILNRMNLLYGKLVSGITFKHKEEGQMTTELMVKRLTEVWDRRPGALLKKRGMLVIDAFKGHLAEKDKKLSSEHSFSDHTRRHNLSVTSS